MAQSKEYHHQYYLRNKEHIKARTKKYQSEHIEWAIKKVYKWNKRNPEKTRAIQKRFRENNKEKIAAYRKEYYARNREHLLWMARGYHRKENLDLKLLVLTHYGNGKCACVWCGMGNIDCLSIDHIDNNGQNHRKILRSRSIYKVLASQNFPDGYQTLCINCQWIKKAENQRRRRLPSRL